MTIVKNSKLKYGDFFLLIGAETLYMALGEMKFISVVEDFDKNLSFIETYEVEKLNKKEYKQEFQLYESYLEKKRKKEEDEKKPALLSSIKKLFDELSIGYSIIVDNYFQPTIIVDDQTWDENYEQFYAICGKYDLNSWINDLVCLEQILLNMKKAKDQKFAEEKALKEWWKNVPEEEKQKFYKILSNGSSSISYQYRIL